MSLKSTRWSSISTDQDVANDAKQILDVLEEEVRAGQRQLFIRPKDFYAQKVLMPEALDTLFRILRADTGADGMCSN